MQPPSDEQLLQSYRIMRCIAADQIHFARLRLREEGGNTRISAYLRGMIIGIGNVCFKRLHLWTDRSWWCRIDLPARAAHVNGE